MIAPSREGARKALERVNRARRAPSRAGLEWDEILVRKVSAFDLRLSELADIARGALDEGGGTAGVREPRMPRPPVDSSGAHSDSGIASKL